MFSLECLIDFNVLMHTSCMSAPRSGQRFNAPVAAHGTHVRPAHCCILLLLFWAAFTKRVMVKPAEDPLLDGLNNY